MMKPDAQSQPFPIWHPFTQHALQTEIVKIVSAKEAYLKTSQGRELFDGISSWWVITHGHCHPFITESIKSQVDKLHQVIFAGHTHYPAEELAEELLKVVPSNLKHVFFSDSGSTSVEVALKMSLGYWQHTENRERTRIIVMEHSYHGDTIGAMSVGQRGVFNAPYKPLMFEVDYIPFPHKGNEDICIDSLKDLCTRGDIAAFIVEPLVLGAGGMRMYNSDTLKRMEVICKTYNVLFIVDEVMTGWGRTGKMFACEHASIQPDIVCYSKGITGGSLPLAVTLCNSDIFNAYYSIDRSKTFFHSSSYTANPIACAAAVANLKLWRQTPVIKKITNLENMQREQKKRFLHDKRFKNVRQTGTIVAMDLVVADEGYFADVGLRLYEFFKKHDLLLRPLGNTIYVMPPYCTTSDDLNHVYDTVSMAAEEFAQ